MTEVVIHDDLMTVGFRRRILYEPVGKKIQNFIRGRVVSSDEIQERIVFRMEELSGWHLTSNTMVEIRLSPLPKEILRMCKSNAGNTISFYSSSTS